LTGANLWYVAINYLLFVTIKLCLTAVARIPESGLELWGPNCTVAEKRVN
jgi:hypothetical protein